MKIFLLVLFLVSSYAQGYIKYSSFIDTYYAYNLSSPKFYKRSFTTQPLFMNEPQINMAYIDATLSEETLRGRLAFQYGTSVDANYILEKNKTLQTIQESYIGKKISDNLWIDAGIFLGNIGAESWFSKNNWTYTRALNLDYVPYYSAGVRFEYFLNSKEIIQFQFINGWQNIEENNKSKAVGIQYKRELNDGFTFTYNNFLGDDIVATPRSRFRHYHNFILKWTALDKWHFIGAIDFGFQSQQIKKGTDAMMAQTLTTRWVLNQAQSVALRAEYYNDVHQTTVATNTSNGFEVVGASINYDHQFNDSLTWRTEARVLNSKDRIYPSIRERSSYNDSILVTSIALLL